MNSELHLNERPRRDQSERSSRTIGGGLVLILIGVIFLLGQVSGFALRNWWALFILIPAASGLWGAYALYRRSGRFDHAARAALFSGLIPLAVALMFLFDLDWGDYWPLFVLLPGLGMLAAGIRSDTPGEAVGPFSRRLHRPWIGWMGLGAVLLGLGFLSKNLGIFDSSLIARNWWGVCILVPAVGGLVSTLRLAAGRASIGFVMANLAATLVVGVVGVVALLGLNWNLITPLILIGVGVTLLIGLLGRGG